MAALRTETRVRTSRHPWLATLTATGALVSLVALTLNALLAGRGLSGSEPISWTHAPVQIFVSCAVSLLPAVLTASAATLAGLRFARAFLWSFLGFASGCFAILVTGPGIG